MDAVTAIRERTQVLQRKQAENDILNERIDKAQASLDTMTHALDVGRRALEFLEQVANSRRGVMKQKIEAVATQALRLIYGPSYGVELVYSVKNNRSNMDIQVVRRTKAGEIKRDMNGFGGGVADCVSVPMRQMVLLGSKSTDRVCVLDEPYKHVDLERIELVSEFLKEVCDKLSVQVLMCSHHEAMRDCAAQVYEVHDDHGTAVVETL